MYAKTAETTRETLAWCGTDQVLDETFQLLLRLPDGLLLPHDGDQLLLGVVRRREDDARPRLVPHAANVGPPAADQEFVVLRFGLQLGREVVDLLGRTKSPENGGT